MKNYSNNNEAGKYFIKNYEIKEDKIVIHYATSKDLILPYNEETEDKILESMEKQVEQADSYLSNIGKTDPIIHFAFFLLIIGFSLMTLGDKLVSFLLNHSANTITIIIGEITLIMTLVIGQVVEKIDNHFKKQEIEKMNLFLSVKKELNEELSKNKNLNNSISKKAQKTIDAAPYDSTKVITINNLDEFNLSDLKKLKSNILEIEQKDLNCEDEIVETNQIIKQKINLPKQK